MSQEHASREESTPAIDLERLLQVVLKRKWVVISFLMILVGFVTIVSLLQKPTFTAKGRLLIEEEPNILTFEKIYKIDNYSGDYYQTQYEMLRSRSLADTTLERLKLYENEKYVGKLRGNKTSGEQPDSIIRERLIDYFLKQLAVVSITNRLIEVRFNDGDPRLAADVVNTLFDAYIDMNIRRRYLTTEQAADFFSKEIAEINAEIEEKEKRLLEYGSKKNIVVLSEKETASVENLRAINQALAEAQIDRLKKEANYNIIKSASPGDIPESLANEVILKLREDFARLNREYIQRSETYKADFPEMLKLKAELDSVRESLANETQNLARIANADYQAALDKEKTLRDAFGRQRFEANKVNSSAILYNSLQAEIENKKTVLRALLTRQSETDVSLRLKGFGASNVSIVDKATVPLKPSSPKKKRNVALAFFVGFLGGLGLAFVFELMDKSVKNAHDVQKYSSLALLGIVPEFGQKKNRVKLLWKQSEKKKDAERPESVKPGDTKGDNQKTESIELITHLSPKSKISENYRSIRTSLLLSSDSSKSRVLAISSPLPQEGKSVTTANLAVTLAQAGKSVLIIDSDLRKPMQHEIFKVANLKGLTDLLSSDYKEKDSIKTTEVPNLFLINSGPVPANPVELLSSEKMARLLKSLKENFEHILIDTPPLLLLSDAFVLASKIDGLLLVVSGGATSREALRQASEKLDSHKMKCLGVILNRADLREHDYYYTKYYQHYYDS